MYLLLIDGELITGSNDLPLEFHTEMEIEMFLEDIEVSKDRAKTFKKEEDENE